MLPPRPKLETVFCLSPASPEASKGQVIDGLRHFKRSWVLRYDE